MDRQKECPTQDSLHSDLAISVETIVTQAIQKFFKNNYLWESLVQILD